jgi:hypothetical protein
MVEASALLHICTIFLYSDVTLFYVGEERRGVLDLLCADTFYKTFCIH